MNKECILILTARDLDSGGGASFRTLYIAKYLSRKFKVFIIDAKRNTYIIAINGVAKRIGTRKSLLSTFLGLIPLLVNRLLVLIFRFPKEEFGRLSSIFNFGIFCDALRIGLMIKPRAIIIEEHYSLYIIALLLKYFLKAKHLVIDLHNIDTVRLLCYPKISKSFVNLIYLIERKATKHASLNIVVSYKDFYVAKKLFNITNIIIVPNFVPYSEIEKIRKQFNGEICVEERCISGTYIVFHGDFRYYPNREALLLLIKHIMPRIWKNHPDIKLVVIGPGLPRVSNGKIVFLGYVPQETLYKLICNATCALIPILRGGGTRIKILEYLACGVPVISTKIGAKGLELENFKHIILVDKVEDIPEMFDLLMKDATLKKELKISASAVIREKYDAFKVLENLSDVLIKLLKTETSRDVKLESKN
jgi:glycosyltransferase involved in cell wall biosynthesis